MRITNERMNNKILNEWLSTRFKEKKTVCVGIDLLACRIKDGQQEWLNGEIIDQTARRFRNKINHHYFGNAARRYGRGLAMTIHLHCEPHKHLHCVIEIPEGEPVLKFKSVIGEICLADGWMNPLPHIAETESVIASQIYNGRFGPDTLILF